MSSHPPLSPFGHLSVKFANGSHSFKIEKILDPWRLFQGSWQPWFLHPGMSWSFYCSEAVTWVEGQQLDARGLKNGEGSISGRWCGIYSFLDMPTMLYNIMAPILSRQTSVEIKSVLYSSSCLSWSAGCLSLWIESFYTHNLVALSITAWRHKWRRTFQNMASHIGEGYRKEIVLEVLKGFVIMNSGKGIYIRPSTCPFIHVPTLPAVHSFIHPPTLPFVHLSVCPCTHPSIHPTIHPSSLPSAYLFFHPCIHPSICLSTHPLICWSIHFPACPFCCSPVFFSLICHSAFISAP